jgi:ubiquinone/menaquinone biosynthesis C-methylase UbiE
MEQKPANFPREVRKKGLVGSSGFEDSNYTLEIVAINFRSFKEILEDLGVNLKNVKVLEIGSGNAIFLDYMKKQGVDAVGVDVRPRGRKDSPQVIARIEQLPFNDESFEVVFSGSVFDSSVYIQNQEMVMEEINRVLKHGGIYVGMEVGGLPAKAIDGFHLLTEISNVSLSIYKKS